MRYFSFIFIIGLFVLPLLSKGETIVIGKDFEIEDISSSLSYYEDVDCVLEFSDELHKKDFIESDGLLNFNVSKSCFWIKIEIDNQSDRDRYQLNLEHAILDLVEFYDKNGLVERISERQPFYDRTYDDPNFIFDVNLYPHQKATYYLKITSGELIIIPVTLGTPDKVLAISSLREMLFGLYAGIILVMFVYNLFVYFSVRDRSYFYYVLYILFVGLTQASLKGFTAKYLWPDSLHLNHYSVTVLSCVAGIFALEFLKVFLHTKELDPKWHKFSHFVNALFYLSIALCILGLTQISFSIMQFATTIGSIYAFIIAIRILRKGYRPAKFFLAAWSILILGAIVFVLKDFEIVPYNIYTNYSLQVSSVLEIVLLSFALADRINILRKEKEQSQLEALQALEENERIIREQNVILEGKVEERTAALKMANNDLNVAMDDLKHAQSKLVSAEKMASLGQLTAGIAHEINNPINFVKASVKPLKDNFAELVELIEMYEANLSKLNNAEATKMVNEFKAKIQLDYLLEETKDVIENIDEGANRTAEIVSGLRTFSHVDDIGIKLTDLSKGIRSTLKLLAGEMPEYLKVKLELSKLPEVECYGGKINQVFMNIINNGIQAIKLKKTDAGLITVRAFDSKGQVRIEIEDNGIGMDEETKEKVFDPFFTTKDVGEGTGLGLSVVYGIIESHHGSIEVQTELGKGSTFIIILPYIQPK